eukprot:3016717-Pyramimonas_sp.AAC.1
MRRIELEGLARRWAGARWGQAVAETYSGGAAIIDCALHRSDDAPELVPRALWAVFVAKAYIINETTLTCHLVLRPAALGLSLLWPRTHTKTGQREIIRRFMRA